MSLSGILYAGVGPYLFLKALTTESVATVVIVQRLESLNLLLLGHFVLGSRMELWDVCNGAVTLFSVLLGVALSDNVGVGVLLVVTSGWCYSTSIAILNRHLQDVPLGLLATFRVALGSVVYHLIANGTDQLAFIYTWHVWKVMLWYSLVYVTLGQCLWLVSLKLAASNDVVVGTTTLLPLSLAWGAVIVGNVPTAGQIVAALMLTGVAVSGGLRQLSRRRQQLEAEDSPPIIATSPPLLAGTPAPATLPNSSFESLAQAFKGV
eukprot:TRINITY_DN14656_c0_g1_i2.p1 TRINITY_DN14656_c0_g1~~TRINITY_DN14656_c0_g1_i2.p1  ORF type:complete len:264 (+),score=91.19 TRINITY_DN14656_c0_g1_i2:356-1147(+)